jgi:hypothetical protein
MSAVPADVVVLTCGNVAGIAGGMWRQAMLACLVLALVTLVAGICVGVFVKISVAIRREDRMKGSLRFDAPSYSAQTARDLVGISSSRWDD